MKRILSGVLASVLTLCPLMSFGGCASDVPLLDGATLVTFGDSLTALSTWPSSVAKELNMNLVNSGIGAHTTEHSKARFERDVLAHDPDFVIIMLGSNDYHRPTGTLPQVSLEDYRSNMQYFIDGIKAIDAIPILMTPPFTSPNASGGPSYYPQNDVNKALDEYVDAMRDLAAENEIGLIDVHQICDDSQTVSTFLGADGVHLSSLGNQVYAKTVCDYMKEHYRQDAKADRVTQPSAPAVEDGAWTKSLISFEPADWLEVFPDTIVAAKEEEGGISFANTNGKWPEMHYNLALDEAIAAPVEGSYLTVDLDLKVGTNILLFFGGSTPTLAYDDHYISLTSYLKAADPAVKISGDDLKGGQSIRCRLDLEDLVPSRFREKDGSVLFTGVKVFVAGVAGQPVTINELSVTATA